MGETAAEVPVLDWKGAYSSSWVGILSPGSMAHPAKFSRGLLDRLLDHGFARGWWEKGSILGDPFGGVGCGGILAAYKGLGWIGIELESRFTSLARENFAKHRRRWEAAGDPRPVILRGDSRHFARLVRTGLAAIITSPPYADGVHGRNGIDIGKCERPGTTSQARSGGYGAAEGQVGALPAGDLDAVLTSPPYVSGGHHADQTGAWGGIAGEAQRHGKDVAGYGQTEGQVGRLREGDLDAVVTSPPWENQEPSHGQGQAFTPPHDSTRNLIDSEYGSAEGQIGVTSGDTYWSAMKSIFEQCFLALRPGGVMCVVVKSFVRDGAVVDLPGQTLRLLCSLGFTPVGRIRAWLVEERREPGLFGGEVVERKSRKSFFRRLHEKKRPGTEIDFEEVLVVRAPGGGTCPDTYDSAGGP